MSTPPYKARDCTQSQRPDVSRSSDPRPPERTDLTPEEQPTAREFGRLEGKVDGMNLRVERVERAIIDSAAASSAEHGEMRRAVEGLGRDFNKALEKRDERIDSLESTRDKGSGAAKLVEVGKGLAILALMVLTYLAAQGQAG